MSKLNEMINERDEEIAKETFVYIVKEDNCVNAVFASEEFARNYILRKIGEFKNDFITSSWHLNVSNDNDCYTITCHRWFFGLFFYKSILKTFSIEQQLIRFA